ncbi:MAG TPA: BolA/IbaG family iron-sulfur metabolism protein [Gammaproteobacteria bacterium]|nr:BolA/IbaG family iron-sulfur metabolism protein [Gammaproteobacteria bacterium]
MQCEEIRELIAAGIPGSEVVVTGDGTHFEATVVTPAFEGKSILEQHRMVYATLGDRMQSEIHALSIRSYTPQQWDQARRLRVT